MEFVSVRPVEVFVTETALEPWLGGVRPVMTPELVSPDKAGPAVLVGAGEGSRPRVVAEVSLQVVPFSESLELIKLKCFCK